MPFDVISPVASSCSELLSQRPSDATFPVALSCSELLSEQLGAGASRLEVSVASSCSVPPYGGSSTRLNVHGHVVATADTRAAAARGLERARSVLAAHAPKETRTK